VPFGDRPIGLARRKLPQNRWPRSASMGHGNRGTMLRYLLALLACLERAPGQAGAAAALPQIAPMEPIRTPFPRAQRRPLESGSPAQTLCGDSTSPDPPTASSPSLRKRSEPLSSEGILSKCGGSVSSANSPSVPRRSISRSSRREASLLVLSKTRSSFAIPRISF
jgi:hypothetical protein